MVALAKGFHMYEIVVKLGGRRIRRLLTVREEPPLSAVERFLLTVVRTELPLLDITVVYQGAWQWSVYADGQQIGWAAADEKRG